MILRSLAAVMCVALLAGCGGSGGGVNAVAIPTAPGGSRPGNSQIRITIPAAAKAASHRTRQFVGSDVLGVDVGVAPHGSTSIVTTAFDVSTGSSLCVTQSGARTCTLNVAAPIGVDDFYVQTFDTAPAAGSIPSGAHVLGQASIQSVTVAGSGTASPINISVLGQVNGITAVAGGQLTEPADGSAHTSTLVVSAYDFGNVPISGPYSNPITVTLSETGGSGHTHLVLNGTASGASATLTQSSDTLAIAYDGGGSAGYYATVSLSAVGGTTNSFNVVPMYVTSTSPYYSLANGFQFTAANQQATLTISEAAGNQTYHVNASTAAGCSSAATFGSVSGSGASASVTITSGSSAASSCPFSLLDGLNSGVQLSYTTTLTNGGVTIGGVSEYAVTSPSNARLSDITAGPDGNMYVAEAIGNDIDKFSVTGTYTQFAVPTANADPGSLIAASDGNIWFVERGSYKVAHMTTGGIFAEANLPTFTSAFPQSLAQGSDGYIYVVDRQQYQIDEFDIFLNSLSQTVLSGSLTPTPYGIAADAHNALYVLDSANNQLAFVNGNPVYVPIPSSNAGATSITNDPGRNLVWFSETNANKIASFDGSTITEYRIGQGDQPGALTVGPDGNIWFVAPGTDTIGRFIVSSSTFQHYAIPTSNASPIGIANGPDGRIWFTEFNTNKVGALTP